MKTIIIILITFSLFDWRCYISTITESCAVQISQLRSWYGCNISINPIQYLNAEWDLNKNTGFNISVCECVGINDTDWVQKECIVRDVAFLILRSKECCKSYHAGLENIYLFIKECDYSTAYRDCIRPKGKLVDSIDMNEINLFRPCDSDAKRPLPKVPRSLHVNG